MVIRDSGRAAFPQSGYGQWAPEGGMSLRDYFAAKAMSGMVANIVRGHVSYGNTRDMAARCYEIADEMLEERAK